MNSAVEVIKVQFNFSQVHEIVEKSSCFRMDNCDRASSDVCTYILLSSGRSVAARQLDLMDEVWASSQYCPVPSALSVDDDDIINGVSGKHNA